MMTAAVLVTEPEKQPEGIATDSILLATIRAARDGDHAAFEELMIRSEQRVARLAWRILGNQEEVKEAIQETFLRLFRHLNRYDESRDFKAWLFRIAVNVCRDLERKRRRRQFLFAPIETALALVAPRRLEQEISDRRDATLLMRGIESLPRKERMAVILRDVEGLETAEVAAILGNSPATVRVQLSRARVKLREWMNRHGGERP